LVKGGGNKRVRILLPPTGKAFPGEAEKTILEVCFCPIGRSVDCTFEHGSYAMHGRTRIHGGNDKNSARPSRPTTVHDQIGISTEEASPVGCRFRAMALVALISGSGRSIRTSLLTNSFSLLHSPRVPECKK
jgi:hypothetical protein